MKLRKLVLCIRFLSSVFTLSIQWKHYALWEGSREASLFLVEAEKCGENGSNDTTNVTRSQNKTKKKKIKHTNWKLFVQHMFSFLV